MSKLPYKVIKAKKLKEGQWLHFPSHHDMLIDSVEDTRDGDIRVRCGYHQGDNTATMFYGPNEKVLLYFGNKNNN